MANNTTQYQHLEGLWKSEGYSNILEIRQGRIRRFEFTQVSCLLSFTEWIKIDDLPWQFRLTEQNTLVFQSPGEAAEKTARPIKSMEKYLQVKITESTLDPETNFEVFWHTFQENFAFFDLYSLDWDVIYQKYRPLVSTKTTQEELFEILYQMIFPIKDRHTMIHDNNGNTKSGGTYPDWIDLERASLVKLEISKQMEAGNPPNGEFAWMMFDPFLRVIKNNYLKDKLDYEFHQFMVYGKISDKIGYLNILRFMNYDNRFEIEEIEKAIDIIIDRLDETEALIIDIRFNLGGYDSHALEVANRFADNEYLALTKQAFERGNLSPLMKSYVKPGGSKQYIKPIFLLTSNYTCSGAEIFTMAMSALPYVTVIGKPTIGCHSDTFDRILPNGWRFSLSNEIYLTHGKKSYERLGLPPHIELDMNPSAFASGKDQILEKAIQKAHEII